METGERVTMWSTLALALATVFLAFASYKNIQITSEIADRGWRPKLYLDILEPEQPKEEDPGRKKLEELIDQGKAPIRSLKFNISWGNSGGSPALYITKKVITNRIKGVLADTMQFRSAVSFAVWPGQRMKEQIAFDVAEHSPNDDLYVHICTWYKDEKGKEYWLETVHYIRFQEGKLVSGGFDGIYVGTVKKAK